MNTLDKQLKGIIEDSISKTMNIKIPIQSNEAERNLLLQIINNQAEKDYVTPEITDVLDSLIDFVPESVTIDGVQAETSSYSYNEGTKTLTINLDDITAGKSKTVTFQVKKKS